MDPDDILDELKGLTEIEEILIAQVFTVTTVYRLREEQTGYREMTRIYKLAFMVSIISRCTLDMSIISK